MLSYAACFGITIGGGDLYFVALLRQRFPTVSLAYSYSAWYFCEILTLLLAGPAGRVFDLTGNYDRTLALLAGSRRARIASDPVAVSIYSSATNTAFASASRCMTPRFSASLFQSG